MLLFFRKSVEPLPNSMSCSCGQVLPPCPTICVLSGNTFQNQNLLGQGVLDNVTNGLVGFRGISGSNGIVATLDAPNKAINLALSAQALLQGANTLTQNTSVALSGFTFQFTGIGGPGADTFTIDPTEGLVIEGRFKTEGQVNLVCGTGDSNSSIDMNTGALINMNNGSTETFASGANLNFVSGSIVKLAGVNIPANSVVTTTVTSGHLGSSLINTFLSSANIQTGYSLVGYATERVLTAGVSGLADVLNVLCTLIADLEALKVPHA